MIQSIVVLAVLLILISLGQTGLSIFFVMGIVSAIIVRHYVKDYNDRKKS